VFGQFSPKTLHLNKADVPCKPWLSRLAALFKCKVFGLNCPKTLHRPLVRYGAPAEIRIVTMAGFHKSGSFEPFL
ncbi:MAG: hypothetical protein J6K94_07620, partial [Ruminiclostridium sp.]|nr:hypothetical protein [Ruminiclostridium sp.]